MEKSKKQILIVGGLLLSGIVAHFLYKKYRKDKEEKSNLVSDMLENFGSANVSQFTITNTSPSAQTVRLFNAYTSVASGVNPDGTPPSIQINPDISFFNQTLLNEPKKLKKIKILVNNGGGGGQSSQGMTVVCKDASGDMASKFHIPYISSGQYQANITEIKFKKLILNGECYIDYLVQGNTTVTLILDYAKSKTKTNFSNV